MAGQFTSADTVLPGNGYDPLGLSRYAYVQGNPETHIDADGHCWPLCTMIIGAVVGAVAGAATSVVSQMASGKSISSVDWGEVGKQAAVGAVAGAVSGLVGPEAGPLVRAAVDTGVAIGSQVLSNALDNKPLGDGVGMAALTGALTSIGMGVAGGALAKGVGRIFGTVAKDSEGEIADGVEQAASCALSFAPSTPVATPSGERSIAQLKTGDAVTAYDPSTGKASTQTVTATTIHQDTNLVNITLQVTTAPTQQSTGASGQATTSDGSRSAASGASSVHRGTSHTEAVHTTTNHPWLTADHGWLPAGFLHIGEPVQEAGGSTATVVAIQAVAGTAAMWDLTVANVHTFAVGTGEYVVHNNCGDTLTDGTKVSLKGRLEHSFTSKGRSGLMHAEDWFGHPVKVQTHMGAWESTIRTAMKSTLVFDSDIGGDSTRAVLAHIDNGGQMQWFVAHFYKDSGELASAFRPNQKQLGGYFKALGF